MEYKVKLIQHKNLTNALLEDIVKLKSLRWPYPFDNQLLWIKNNILENDYHLLLYFEESIFAYCNFVDINVTINNELTRFKGLGNVCTSISGKGYGDILMNEINNVLNFNNWKGILLCRDELIKYYQKFDWNLPSKNLIYPEQFRSTNMMTYNLKDLISSIDYSDRLF